jgi:uncharacterized membrane protein HdeD (DUF308 family)
MRRPAFWIPLLRGVFAISLGVALLFQPDRARPMLVNFFGMYWLVAGLVSIRWGARGERARGLPLVAGVVGVLTGLVAIGRSLMSSVLSEVMVLYLLGTVILLTGVLHMFGGFRTGEPRQRQWSWGSLLLGLFEVVLGAILLLEPYERGPILNSLAAVWGLVGGAMLIGDALRVRAQAIRAERENAARGQAQGAGGG